MARLKRVLNVHDLILNNKPGKTILPTWRKTTLIIKLTFTTAEVDALDTCIINEELSTLLHHEIIVCNPTDPDGIASNMGISQQVTVFESQSNL